MKKLLELTLGRKRIERLTERIGAERVEQRQREVEEFASLTLMRKIAGPAGVEVPEAACVMADGGRFQQTTLSVDSKTHWREYKAGFCGALGKRVDELPAGEQAPDPLPDVPSFLLNLEQMETLTREIGRKAAGEKEPADSNETDGPELDLKQIGSLEELEQLPLPSAPVPGEKSKKPLPFSPPVTSRDVVATGENCELFGDQLAARAWQLGLFQSPRKAFVADGGSWLWTLWARHFKPFGFVGVLDIIHAVTYLYAAAMAGRPKSEGGVVYQRWIRWVWCGQVADVIAEVALRQQELGLPEEGESETSPRHIVSGALTYLQNQQSRMNYPRYRKLGLPITSSLMESTVKQLNQRIKGTEKFWSESGGESVLQLKADTLSESDPLEKFWTERQNQQTGFYSNCRTQQKKTAA